jgi:hypothetical protein
MPTSPRPFAFVLMPFESSYDDVYQLAIQAACEEAGAYAERVDKQIFSGNILERVFNQIAKADLIVADMSERNPNVFYEVGYAHALGKTAILLTKRAEDIPFDLQQYPHIVYGESLSRLKADLSRTVRWHLENPRATATANPEIVVHVNEVRLEGMPAVPAKRRGQENSIRLTLTFKNSSAKVMRRLTFQVGLLVPRFVGGAVDEDARPYIGIADGEQLVLRSPRVIDLLPEQLDEIRYRLLPEPGLFPDRVPSCVRLYLESGSLDYPFMMQLLPSISA